MKIVLNIEYQFNTADANGLIIWHKAINSHSVEYATVHVQLFKLFVAGEIRQ